MRFSLLLLFMLVTIESKDITPSFKLSSFGYISDFAVDGDTLYASTDIGTVDIFSISKKKMINRVALPLYTTARGILTSPKVISVDVHQNRVLVVSIGINGFRNIWIYENYELKNIVDESKRLTIKEARFKDDGTIVFATFGSEIILKDLKESFNIYRTQVSQSSMSDIALNSAKDKMVTADESGAIRMVDVQTSKLLGIYESQNVDRVYSVAFKEETIITAGQDRRVGVYKKGIKPYHIKSQFLVFCVGLNSSGNIGAYSSTESSNIQLFRTQTGEMLDTLVGHKGIINKIEFIDNHRIITSGSMNDIFIWER